MECPRGANTRKPKLFDIYLRHIVIYFSTSRYIDGKEKPKKTKKKQITKKKKRKDKRIRKTKF